MTRVLSDVTGLLCADVLTGQGVTCVALSPSHICHLVTVFTPRVSRLILEQGQNKGSQKTLISASDLTRTLSALVSAGAGHISLDKRVWD